MEASWRFLSNERERGGGVRGRPTAMHVLFQTTFMLHAVSPLNLFFLYLHPAAEAFLDIKNAHMEPNSYDLDSTEDNSVRLGYCRNPTQCVNVLVLRLVGGFYGLDFPLSKLSKALSSGKFP
jgi:hypothetical protein